jgi:hypothetical protein
MSVVMVSPVAMPVPVGALDPDWPGLIHDRRGYDHGRSRDDHRRRIHDGWRWRDDHGGRVDRHANANRDPDASVRGQRQDKGNDP